MNENFMNSYVIENDMKDIYSHKIAWSRIYGSTIVVTGATGMIASYLVYYLIYLNEVHDADIKIVAMVRNREKCIQRFKEYAHKKYFSIYTDNICENIKIKSHVDYIIHAASLASPNYYENSPIEVAAPNALATYFMLNFASKCKCRSFLYFSSGDIYGKPVENGNITEETLGLIDPLDPHSCYGESKRMGEVWCASFARENNVNAVIARIGHTYSPTMDIEKDPRVFASFMKCIVEGQNIVMHSDGSAQRPFCYITDAVAAYLLILLDGKKGQAYNVCNTDQFLSMSELADILVSLRPELKLTVEKQERDNKEKYLENVSNHANKVVETKLMNLGWNHSVSVKEGFSRVLQYLQERTKD